MELEESKDKWNRGVDLFTESVYKPDEKLRQCARNQDCYQELMDVRAVSYTHLTLPTILLV